MSSTTFAPGADKQEWAQAGDKAKEAAASVGEMASHTAAAVGAMASQAACGATKRVDDLAASAGASIHSLGDRLAQNAPNTGMLGDASQAVARGVRESGEYIENAKLSGMTEDVAHLVRRNPIPTILIALGIGWFLGRTLRS